MPHEAPPALFRRAVLGLTGGGADVSIVRLACALAKPGKAELIGIHVVEVDWSRDIADDIASNNETAAAILDRAEAIAEREGVALRTELVQARDVGAALVDEATERDADQLMIGLPYRQRFGGDFAIGSTVPYVLQNAPCTVTILRDPIGAPEPEIRATATPVPAGRSAS